MNERPLLLRNVNPGASHWSLYARSERCNRDAIDARAHIVTAAREQWNRVTTPVGYGCSSDRVVHFGLGHESKVKLIEIEWPSGARQKLENVDVDQFKEITEPPMNAR